MQHLNKLSGAAMLLAACAMWGLTAPAVAAECRDGADEPQVVITACSAAIDNAESAEEKARLLTEMAKVQRKTGDKEAAATSIDQATALAPGDADAWIEKGYLEHDLGDLEGALAAHTKARDAQPDYWRAALVRLNSLADVGRFEECLTDAARALKLAPDRAHTYAYRGRCFSELGRTDEAIADYQKAANIGLEQPFLHSNLALAYLDAGRNEEALAAARHAIELDPEYEPAQWSLVEALMALGRNQEAVEAYEATQDAGLPDTQGRANQLAWLLYLAGDYATARPIMEGYFSSEPQLGAEQAYEADTYGHILAALGETGKAVEMFLLAAELGGAEKVASYDAALEQLGIDADPAALEAALRSCAERGAACRLSE